MSCPRNDPPYMAPLFASRRLAGYLCHLASVHLHEAAVALLCQPLGDDPWGRDDPDDEFLPGAPTMLVEHVCDRCRGSQEVSAGDHDRDWCDCGTGLQFDPITLHDVAPRLSAAVDVVRRKLERMRTVALRRIGL